jgi:hypothetical protein
LRTLIVNGLGHLKRQGEFRHGDGMICIHDWLPLSLYCTVLQYDLCQTSLAFANRMDHLLKGWVLARYQPGIWSIKPDHASGCHAPLTTFSFTLGLVGMVPCWRCALKRRKGCSQGQGSSMGSCASVHVCWLQGVNAASLKFDTSLYDSP